jgi:hypothetical protein
MCVFWVEFSSVKRYDYNTYACICTVFSLYLAFQSSTLNTVRISSFAVYSFNSRFSNPSRNLVLRVVSNLDKSISFKFMPLTYGKQLVETRGSPQSKESMSRSHPNPENVLPCPPSHTLADTYTDRIQPFEEMHCVNLIPSLLER